MEHWGRALVHGMRITTKSPFQVEFYVCDASGGHKEDEGPSLFRQLCEPGHARGVWKVAGRHAERRVSQRHLSTPSRANARSAGLMLAVAQRCCVLFVAFPLTSDCCCLMLLLWSALPPRCLNLCVISSHFYTPLSYPYLPATSVAVVVAGYLLVVSLYRVGPSRLLCVQPSTSIRLQFGVATASG